MIICLGKGSAGRCVSRLVEQWAVCRRAKYAKGVAENRTVKSMSKENRKKNEKARAEEKREEHGKIGSEPKHRYGQSDIRSYMPTAITFYIVRVEYTQTCPCKDPLQMQDDF